MRRGRLPIRYQDEDSQSEDSEDSEITDFIDDEDVSGLGESSDSVSMLDSDDSDEADIQPTVGSDTPNEGLESDGDDELGEDDESGVDDESDTDDGEYVMMEPPQEVLAISGDENEEEQEEEEPVIQSEKRIKLDEEAQQKSENQVDDDEEKQCCPICLDEWSSSGDHRLCCLKCGHLFGLSCITQWLNTAQNAASRKCPECNTKANKSQIRILYAKKLVSTDTYELEKLKSELKDTTEKKTKAEIELDQYKMREQQFNQQMEFYKSTITDLENKIEILQKSQVASNCTFMQQIRVFDICNQGACRVMAYDSSENMVIISSQDTISKVFLANNSKFSPVKLHNSQIRDLAFHRSNPNTLLSVGFDKKIVLTDMKGNITIHKFESDANLWSCGWSNYNHFRFFAGTHNGKILEFDTRKLDTSFDVLENGSDRSPVVSLASIPVCDTFSASGLISCQLNSCFAYSYREGNYKLNNKLNVDGPLTSMRYSESTNHFLISGRPNSSENFSKQILCSAQKTNNQVSFNRVHVFNSGKTQSQILRPCHLQSKGENLVVAYNESKKQIMLWSVATGEEIQSLPFEDPVFDFCYFEKDGGYLAALTSKRLHLFSMSENSSNKPSTSKKDLRSFFIIKK